MCLRQFLTAVSKLQGQNAALMQVKLVFVRFSDMKDLHVAALHSYSEPFSCRTVAKREDLQQEKAEIRSCLSFQFLTRSEYILVWFTWDL